MTFDWLLRIGATLIVGYVLAVAAIFLLQRSLMYFPFGDLPPPADAGVPEMEIVEFGTADGLVLTAWYAEAAPGRPTVALFHGNAGNIAGRAVKARLMMQEGYGVMLVEYRGYGGNPGRPDEDGLYDDGRAALEFLAGRGVAAGAVVLYGESLGTGVAIQLATEHDVAALILEAPFTSAVDVGQRVYWFLPVRILMLDRFESLDKIDRIDAPLLVFHGQRDRVVPIEFGKRLFEAANEPKTSAFFPMATHHDLFSHGAGRAVLAFLERLSESGK